MSFPLSLLQFSVSLTVKATRTTKSYKKKKTRRKEILLPYTNKGFECIEYIDYIEYISACMFSTFSFRIMSNNLWTSTVWKFYVSSTFRNIFIEKIMTCSMLILTSVCIMWAIQGTHILLSCLTARRFLVQTPAGAFLCGVCMFSPCLRASGYSHSPKTCTLVILNCP